MMAELAMHGGGAAPDARPTLDVGLNLLSAIIFFGLPAAGQLSTTCVQSRRRVSGTSVFGL
jgi:hypothetical protein